MDAVLAYHCRVKFRTDQIKGICRNWTAQHIETMLYSALTPLLSVVTDLDELRPPYVPLIKDGTLPVLQRKT